jgi:uncharacterized protein (TIGR03067 family)
MTPSLPGRPNLEHLRTQAKELLANLRAGDPAAAQIFIEHLPSTRGKSPQQVRDAGLRLADAQSAIARRSGFAAWPSLARHVDELRAFEGEWTFLSLEVDGAAMPAAMMTASRMLLDGDAFRMESPEATYEGVFTIDIEAEPAQIDIQFTEGPEAGHWSYGIYRLHEDELVFCLGLTGAPRPTAFMTRPGSGHALERLRRTSASRPKNVRRGPRQPKAVTTVPAAPIDVDETGFDDPMTPLLERLQGEWMPVTLVTSGQSLAETMLPFGTRIISGRETKVIFGGQVMVHAKMRIDESKVPVAVDYLNVGRGPRTVTLGILDLDEDRVRFCMAAAGAARPDEFSSVPGSGRILSEWRRK